MKFYGQFEYPSVDEYLYLTFFRGVKEGTFIECGANDGVMHSSCLFFEETLNWKGYNIEADSELFKELSKNRKDSDNFNMALTDQESSGKQLSFTKVISPHSNKPTGLGQVLMPDDKQETLSSDFKLEKNVLFGQSYKDFCAENAITKVDLFVLDVEGHELAVLKGMKGSQALPKVMCVEYPLIGLDRIMEHVIPLGYSFHSKVHNNAHFVRK